MTLYLIIHIKKIVVTKISKGCKIIESYTCKNLTLVELQSENKKKWFYLWENICKIKKMAKENSLYIIVCKNSDIV